MFFTRCSTPCGVKSHGGDIALCNHSKIAVGSVDRDAAADTCGIGVGIGEQVLDVRLELREYGAGVQLLHQGHEQTADDNDNNGNDDNIEERAFTAFVGQTGHSLFKKLLHVIPLSAGSARYKNNDVVCMYSISPEDVTPLPAAPRVEGCRKRAAAGVYPCTERKHIY